MAFNIAPVSTLQKNELYFHLYLHHTYGGSNPNQTLIVDPKLPTKFGRTVVNDWPVYDGNGTDKTIVARAQGVHIQAAMSLRRWENYFSIVFEDDRFKGSSLQVMGPVVEQGEWAIVGGTGQFRMAQGIIFKKVLEAKADGNILELDIHAFYYGGQPWTLGV
ncbi:pterocarpan synthase 1-like [Carex rostrata]